MGEFLQGCKGRMQDRCTSGGFSLCLYGVKERSSCTANYTENHKKVLLCVEPPDEALLGVYLQTPALWHSNLLYQATATVLSLSEALVSTPDHAELQQLSKHEAHLT